MRKMGLFGKLLHGGDYNPEQWLDRPDILEKDIEYFKKAKINEVSLGIFSWAVLEPEEGQYRFEWLEEIIHRMYENGISVILATPSAARPKWMADRYPEVLRMDPKGQRDHFGRRHNHCYTSPVYREKVRKINYALASRFGKQPGVIAWHISNELEGSPYPCFCPLCQEAFRNWLRARYGSIDQLNKAWATAFWSHLYQDFSQIEPPFENGERSVHGLNLDWKRFITDQVVDFTKAEIRAVRDAGSQLPTTVNMMYHFDGLNYRKFRDVVDFVSWDNYPQWHKKDEKITAMQTGLMHDYIRSIKKEPFILMESSPSAMNWNPVSKLKRPGVLQASSMQALAHGSDSVLYFQLRQSRGSFEKFHGAVIDHYGGDDTRVFGEVMAVGESMEQLTEITGANVNSPVAIVYDMESRWAMEDAAGPRNSGLHYKEVLEKNYSAFRKCGLNVDVIDMEQELDGYQIVAAPMLYMFRAGFEKKIRAFVENGGRFIMTYWSGIADETDLCFLGGTPHDLTDVFGLRSTEIDGLYDWDSNRIRNVSGGRNYTCRNLCELVKTDRAKTLYVYDEDFYAGMPAVTENSFGRGKAFYICADLEAAFYEDFYRRLVSEAGIELPLAEVPDGIEVSTRQKEDTEYLFVQNYGRESAEVSIPDQWTCLTGNFCGRMNRYETAVFRRKLQRGNQ